MFEALFLGLLQGLTEFLPISSSAHLRLAGEFLPNAGDPGATFTAITQIGTELAVLIYFRKDIARIAAAWLSKVLLRKEIPGSSPQDVRLGWMIILGSLPIVVLGYLFQENIRNTFRSLWLIAIVMILFAIVLAICDKFGKSERTLSALTSQHGFAYGFAQSLALVPGVSRSGSTIAMGRFLGYTRESALRYSFLLAVPAVFGSGLYELKTAIGENDSSAPYSLIETFGATVDAFFVGYVVIAWLMKFISTRSFMPFIVYRIALGTTILVLLSAGVINP
ncbi:MAG: undecaprenyl-diphosphate phosphatase [Candidatus Planktophila sp.]